MSLDARQASCRSGWHVRERHFPLGYYVKGPRVVDRRRGTIVFAREAIDRVARWPQGSRFLDCSYAGFISGAGSH